MITSSEVVITFPSESVHWKVEGVVDPSVVAVQVNVTSTPTCTGLGDSSTEVCRKVPAVSKYGSVLSFSLASLPQQLHEHCMLFFMNWDASPSLIVNYKVSNLPATLIAAVAVLTVIPSTIT